MGIEKIKDLADDLPVLPWCWHTGASAAASWEQGAQLLHGWLAARALPSRDAVVVLPQLLHVGLAKQAWARAVGGWMPRFETVGSLLQRLSAISAEPVPVGLVLDDTLDLLWIERQLRQSAQGRRWLREATAQAEVAMARAMALAHDWIRVCISLPANERQAYEQHTLQWCQQHQVQTAGANAWQPSDAQDIGARERWLTGQALAWAMQSYLPLAHRYLPLFEHLPSAWVLVTVGTAVVPGSDASLMLNVLRLAQSRQVPVCWMPAMWAGEHEPSGAGAARTGGPTLTKAQHFNDEAQAAAAWVLAAVRRRREARLHDPVVLVTQDRVLSRRVRALLMAQECTAALVIQDESGWTLSTTRAAAAVTRLLAAAQPAADTWGILDWLIHGWLSMPAEAGSAQGLEAAWRQQQVFRPWVQDMPQADLTEQAAPTGWPWARQVLLPLHELATTAVPLTDALARLQHALQAAGVWDALLQDEAGQAVVQALRLQPTHDNPLDAADGVAEEDALSRQWTALAQHHMVNLSTLMAWVQQCLGRVNFEPSAHVPGAGNDALPPHVVDVVLTPMGRAVLRPFSCVVMPGVDEGQLGVLPPAGHLLGSSEAGLGLPAVQTRWQAQWDAFALLAAQPEVRAVYRQSRDGEPVAPAAWLGRWWSLAQPGTWQTDHWPLAPDPRTMLTMASQPRSPVQPSLVVSDALRPVRLSPTAYQRLRDCPYRYFALDLLQLRETDELDEGMAQQDYGNWLHEVLRRFHAPELEGRRQWLPEQDLHMWLSLADDVAREQGLQSERKRAHLALYQSTLQALAAQYVAWHHEQQAGRWAPTQIEQHMEVTWSLDVAVAPSATCQLTLYGKLDRVDAKGAGASAQWRVIDYKTGSLSGLKQKVKEPLEDAQLAFYALLVQAAGGAVTAVDPEAPALQAVYLHLSPDQVQAVLHPDVPHSAQQLAQGIRSDMTRLHQGHPMHALGEGRLCDRCEARGLCRKDHQPRVSEVKT